MFRILLLLLLGVGVGYGLRRLPAVRRVESTTRFTVYALLFVFGTTLGMNRSLISQLGYFGWQAAVIALLGALGSFGAASLLQRLVSRKGDGR